MNEGAPHVFAFEEIDASLALLPLAARRALDAGGCKVSLATWREAPLDVRQRIVTLGAADEVDVRALHALLAASAVVHTLLPNVPEPSREAPPPEVPLEAPRWRALTPLARYALAKVARGRHAENVERNLPRALDELAPKGHAAPESPRASALSSHLTDRGEAHMVDVGAKPATDRRAVAVAEVRMHPATVARLRSGDTPKGDVLATARIAGIQAAKRTPDLIPLCHAIALTKVVVDLTIEDGGVRVEASADAHDRTGVEMEAMTAASVAALTLYDMLKGIDRGMTIALALHHKSGGKTGTWARADGDRAR